MTEGSLSASLELYSPFDVSQIDVRDRKVPLEADLSTPLAYSLEESVLWKFATAAFFSGEQKLGKTGLYLVQPYQEGKIPVIFVHGTASSPATWARMFNGLQGNHELRNRFQFWFFIYTTGNPIAYSASLLRDSLREAVSTFDPAGTDPALKQIVVIGHSQGGLLTKMMVTKSDDKCWRNISDKNFDEMPFTEEQRAILRRSLFFEPLPYVRRVIFIATPQRGSFIAGNWIGKLGSMLVTMPVNIIKLGTGMFSKLTLPPEFDGHIPTSVDNMSPDHPFIKTLASIPVEAEVDDHSIIAVEGEGDPTQGDDGVVAYKSAHLNDTESELVVQSGHSVLGHPLAIGEVRRILLEHLRKTRLPRK